LPQRRRLEARRRYVETESGRKPQRPKLTAALAHAKAIGATVVIAKLDRLTRNVDVLRSLVASGAGLVFCDLPQIPDGAMGRFMLTQMASVAELEAGLISERTKAALRAARKRIAIEGQRGHGTLSASAIPTVLERCASGSRSATTRQS
jgi:DNA invertase Pin-like site-specific DNA recombinase